MVALSGGIGTRWNKSPLSPRQPPPQGGVVTVGLDSPPTLRGLAARGPASVSEGEIIDRAPLAFVRHHY